MRPIGSNRVIQFLQWVSAQRPEIRSLETIDERRFLQLANEFEEYKLDLIPGLRDKWRATYRSLRDDQDPLPGYAKAQIIMRRLGVRARGGAPPQLDAIRRYREVPLHAVLLYSSEDKKLVTYIQEHWAALNSLSGDYCDIYASLANLAGEENVYEFIDYMTGRAPLGPLSGIADVPVTRLPGVYLWDETNYALFPLDSSSEGSLREDLRALFDVIRGDPTVNSVDRLLRSRAALGQG